ncbi:MAG: sialate O-acetylesterase [Lacipirellulaceae bacterium]
MTHARRALFILLFAAAPALHAQELRLAGVFTDHVVLQRERPAPVWGWAAPGQELTVEFAGQKRSAEADTTGKWLVTLDPMALSAEGRELVVRSNADDRVSRVSDVLVGDVWLCSGQSNMHFQMNRVANSRDEIASADHPKMRYLKVEERFAQRAEAGMKGVWKPVSPATASECSAVAYYFGRELLRSQDVPIGLLVSSVGGTRIETWMAPETIARLGVAQPLVDKWKNISPDEFGRIVSAYKAYQHQLYHEHPRAVAAARKQGEPAVSVPRAPSWRGHDCPGALHNGMIAPLRPFAIRGVIWYQGEGNVGNPAGYERMLPALIGDWRRTWGEELPFLFVQLAPHKGLTPRFREAQHRIEKSMPNTAMVVTTDVGDANDIHPTRKQPVGERLALAARALSYGEEVEHSGPVFTHTRVKGREVAVGFDHVGAGLVARGDTLEGFSVAGRDKRFFPAQARVENGDTVIVSSADVPQPVAVRYAWAAAPLCNLFSADGLPAIPFRTDDWR